MYIDAIYEKRKDIIKVVERINGKREFREVKANYDFYIKNPAGGHRSIFGDRLEVVKPRTFEEKQKLNNMYRGKTFESDVKPIDRFLELEYPKGESPKMHVAFFDIETDFDKKTGYSDPEHAENQITSIAVYLQWIDTMVCLAIPPKSVSREEADKIAEEVGNTIIYDTEKEMLDTFMTLIDDADCLSGWNSEAFDIPYTVNRIIRLYDKFETKRLCLWDKVVEPRKFMRGSKESQTYDLVGRVHLDYMQLYKNYNFEERHSYALDAIAEVELGENKVAYDGTLDELYNNDFKKFLEYNIQDTMLLDRLDKKLQYIDLCTTIAHANSVLIPATMGTVAMTDQAIMIEAHRRGMIAPNKKFSNSDARIAGGWVAKPKKGLHKWVGSSDLTSLYPSVIRALNMSPETIVGQVDLTRTDQEIDKFVKAAASNSFAGWWNDRFVPLEMEGYINKDPQQKESLKFESGESFDVTGAELNDLIFKGDQPWTISANGTIFRHDIEGLIPGILTRWFSERKQLQHIKDSYVKTKINKKEAGVVIPNHIKIDDYEPNKNMNVHWGEGSAFKIKDLEDLIEEGNPSAIKSYLEEKGMILDENRKVIFGKQEEIDVIIGYWDKRQLLRKLLLNGTYGCLTNPGSRFFDRRIGQSTTLTGRNITKHMAAKSNEIVSGIYDHYGESVIYGDTDSVYYSLWPEIGKDIENGLIDWDKEKAIAMYDKIGDDVSDSFPSFLKDTFNVPLERSTGVVKSKREIVAESGIFITKKRYAAMVFDDEGERKDVEGKPGKVKAMGLDLRRADTPKFVQDFLMDILVSTLTGQGEEAVVEKIKEFKISFEEMKPWQKGKPTGVKRLTHYKDIKESMARTKLGGSSTKKVSIPGHVQASINWNQMRKVHNDVTTKPITDGSKVIVCKLKETSTNYMKSIAYPVDETRLPEWFTNLPFDDEGMLQSVVNKKIDNLLGPLKWDFSKTDKQSKHFDSLFGPIDK